jgi:integrase
MPRLALTEKAVAKLPTKTGRQTLYWDDGPRAVRGFGVLCSGATSNKAYVVQRDLPGGKTRRVTIAGVNELSLEEARKRAADLVLEMRRGVDPKARIVCATLRETMHAYRKARGTALRGRSLEHYSQIERYLGDWMDRPLIEITREHVEQRHKEIAARVVERRRADFAARAKKFRARAERLKSSYPDAAERYRAKAAQTEARQLPSGHATANGVMRAVRMYWNFAADRNPALPPNPVRLRRQWFHVPRRERLVPADHLPAFYAAVTQLTNPVARDYILLLLFTGLRRREAAGLRWDDVDFRGGVIRIPAARTKARRKLDLPMSDFVRSMLIARRQIGGDYIFPANSKTGYIAEPKFAFDLISKSCGLRVSPHDLRRTFLTVAESTDISPLALKALVNHATGNDVTAGYVHLSSERLREAAQKVTTKMKDLCGVPADLAGNVAAFAVA